HHLHQSSPLRVRRLSIHDSHGRLSATHLHLVERQQDILVCGLPEEAVVRVLDEDTYERAMIRDPVGFHAVPGELLLTRNGALRIRMRPYAYVRIDCQ